MEASDQNPTRPVGGSGHFADSPCGSESVQVRIDTGARSQVPSYPATAGVIRRQGPGTRYYGAFFWLSLVSFAVPLFVAARGFQAVAPTTKPTPLPDASGVDPALWDYLLKTYVAAGRVDYRGLQRDYLFRTYLRQVGAARPEKLDTDAERLAFYCNAYNALVIQGVIVHKIANSVLDDKIDGAGFFDREEYIVAGRTMSLNQLETELRSRFHDPRLHMALVCGARGCPSLRPEAYIGPRLEVQLDDQVRLFCNDRRHVAQDSTRGVVLLNSILKWYASDWEKAGGPLQWVAARVDDPALRDALLRAERGDLAVEFRDYDWSLNSMQQPVARVTSAPATPARPTAPSPSERGGPAEVKAAGSNSIPGPQSEPQGGADFGSGSIPNE
ncbi:MAG: DUF547 domain-containing protein [Isosphaeraceae bacterium]